jgi:hypothetical protein
VPLLLRPPEQAAVDRFAQDVALNRFDYVGARLKGVGCGLHVQFGVQGIEFKNVVVKGAVCARSRTAVRGTWDRSR